MSLWRTKSIEQSIKDTDDPDTKLRKDLGALDLVVFGIGVIIGAGIFVLTGTVAATNSGPALAISFVIAAVACGLAGLCYAEFASTVPVAGSAYTFSYATLGELVAWIIGWDLVLEFTIGSAALASGFSGYLQTVLDSVGITLPTQISSAADGFVDIPAMVCALLVMLMLIRGTKFSSRFNQVVVAIKLFVVAIVIVVGITLIDTDNWSPFIPPSQPGKAAEGLTTPLLQVITGMTPATYGVMGIMAGAAIVFFAYIGFDVVATTAEEARNPQRDLPRGILGSLAICTVLYVAVTLVITGMQNYKDIDPKAALASAFTHVGKDGYATLISAGAVAGLTTVVMTLIIGATRVTFAMSRDHLIPGGLGRTNPKTGTPVKLTLIIGTVVALIASLTPIGKLEEMVNIGTLTAFMLVSLAVPILRKRRPDLKRSFKVPGNPVVPWLSAAACFYLVLNLSVETWIRFVVWMVLGFLIYFFYSRQHSKLATGEEEAGVAGTTEVLSER